MNEYQYVGAVRGMYGSIRNNRWVNNTIAVSKEKALSNLTYRYSVQYKCPISDVKLNPKYLTLVREGV